MTSRRLALVLASSLLVAPSVGCSSSPGGGEPAPTYPDVTFQGSATHAALTAMLAEAAIDDPTHAAFFDNPKDLSALPGTPIITFTWHDAQPHARMELLPRPAKAASFTGTLADLLERTAYAQSAAMSGPGYLLAFRTLDTHLALFRVFTSSTSYTPDASAWAKLATGMWTTLQITSATFADDQVAAGPYAGQVINFCVGWN